MTGEYRKSNFLAATKQRPCRVCGHEDWCSATADGALAFCRRVKDAGAEERRDRHGEIFWLHSLEPDAKQPYSQTPLYPSYQTADTATCDQVYRELLVHCLELSPAHRQHLKNERGLTDEVIEAHGFRSWPSPEMRSRLAARLAREIGPQQALGVPGIRLIQGRLTLSGPSGSAIAIPCFDLAGKVTGIRLRLDETTSGARYQWVSSSPQGPGAKPVPFWSSGRRLKRCEPVKASFVRLLEGEFKAIISAAYTDTFSVSVPGVGLWRLALPWLKTLGTTQVHLAFDQDWPSKPPVARAILEAWKALREQGMEVDVRSWPQAYKGFDDYVLALKKEAV